MEIYFANLLFSHFYYKLLQTYLNRKRQTQGLMRLAKQREDVKQSQINEMTLVIYFMDLKKRNI
jgi:hypothetical protein